MFIVMFSSPSKYLVFRKKKNKLTASVQSGFYEAVSTGIASAGPGNRAIGQTIYIYTRSCPSEQCENKSEFHEMESDTTNHMYII